MNLTIVNMSYLTRGEFVNITVKTDGEDYEAYVNGVPTGEVPTLVMALEVAIATSNFIASEDDEEGYEDTGKDGWRVDGRE